MAAIRFAFAFTLCVIDLPKGPRTGCSEEREEGRRPRLESIREELENSKQRSIQHTASVLVHLWLGLDERHLDLLICS